MGRAAGGAAPAPPTATGEHAVYINVNPLLPGHSLLVPFIDACLPQAVSPPVMEIALAFAAMARRRRDLRVGFNSIGAWASVNHCHWHVFYVGDTFGSPCLPIEHAATEPLTSAPYAGGGGGGGDWTLSLAKLTGWPLPGFVFSIAPSATTATATDDYTTPPGVLAALARAAGGFVADALIRRDIAHTLLIGPAGRTVYVLPRQHQRGGGAEAGELAVALAESCGLAIVYTQEAYDTLTGHGYRATLAAFATPPPLLDGDLRTDAVAAMLRATAAPAPSA